MEKTGEMHGLVEKQKYTEAELNSLIEQQFSILFEGKEGAPMGSVKALLTAAWVLNETEGIPADELDEVQMWAKSFLV